MSSLARDLRVIEHLRAGTLLTHCIAIALLLPNRIAEDAAASRALEVFCEPLRERCERLFVRAPKHVDGNDFEDAPLREHALQLARMLSVGKEGKGVRDAGGIVITGEIAKDRIAALLPELEGAPFGSALLWILAAELLGTSIRAGGSERDALAAYRAELLQRFGAFADQSPQVFWRALTQSRETALPQQLAGVLDALRGAAHLATGAAS